MLFSLSQEQTGANTERKQKLFGKANNFTLIEDSYLSILYFHLVAMTFSLLDL